MVDSDDSLSEGELERTNEMNWKKIMPNYLISNDFEMCMSKATPPFPMISPPKLL